VDGYVRAASAGMLAAVGLVLIIACANVASLLLARSSARRRELAVRAAIGAGRGRLIRQLLTEGLTLAVLGGALGTLLAMWAGRLIGALAASVLPLRTAFDFSLDATVLAFSLAVSVVTALLFGLAPAWAASRPELVPALKDTGEGDLSRGRRITLRDALVVGQLALSLVLLVAGALLARGLIVARGADVGFDANHVASLSFSLQMNGYDQSRATAFHDRALAALRALPGVTAVADASRLPLSADVNMDGYTIDGHHGPKDDPTTIDTATGGPDYFTAVGIPIVEGRGFTEQDVAQGRPLAVINETMARQYWPGRSAVGQTVHAGDLAQPRLEVIGVMRDHNVRAVGEAPRPYVIRPPRPSRRIQLAVHTAARAESALPALRSAIWALEPNVVFTEDMSAAEVVDATRAPTRIAAMLVGAFGLLALLLATVGLYGVVAYSVSLRTREVGIRMALGAERGQIVRMILGEGGRLAIAGVGLGALGAAAVARLLESLLYGVSAIDPLAYGGAALVLVLVALAANLAPALGASRVAPVRALRT
jgi:predicted permease